MGKETFSEYMNRKHLERCGKSKTLITKGEFYGYIKELLEGESVRVSFHTLGMYMRGDSQPIPAMAAIIKKVLGE